MNLKRVLCLMLLLWLAALSCLSEEMYLLPEIQRRRNGPEEHQAAMEYLQIEPWTSCEPDYTSFSCAAVSQNGTVAAMVGTKEHGLLIVVYSSQGTFLYGYQISIKSAKGSPVLFFSKTNDVCLNISYPISRDTIFVLGQNGEGVLESYNIPEDRLLWTAGATEIYGANTINVARDSQYRVYVRTSSRLAIQSLETKEVVEIFDFTEAYEDAHRDNWKSLFVEILFGIALGLSILLYGRWLYRRMNE